MAVAENQKLRYGMYTEEDYNCNEKRFSNAMQWGTAKMTNAKILKGHSQ